MEDLELILERTRPLWERMRGRRILLTGATGFFGAWLLESLAHCNRELQLDVRATVLSRDPAGFAARLPHLAKESCCDWIRGDVRDFAFPDGKFAYVIQGAAATSTEAAARPAELLSTLMEGTRRVLRLAEQSPTQRFLFLSSGAVYGPQPAHLSHLKENDGDDSPGPLSAYAEGKRGGEAMCREAALKSGIEIRIARCFAFVGPHLPLDQHFAIGNFIGDALAGREIAIRGDGTPMRSYLYAADLAIWLWTLLLADLPGENPGVFNVGSGDAVSIRELAEVVVEELSPGLPVRIAGTAVPGAVVARYVPDVRKAEERLGLRPTIGLRDAIRRTAAWARRAS
jgi:nucleoside-diphosphate-sugar epimerase